MNKAAEHKRKGNRRAKVVSQDCDQMQSQSDSDKVQNSKSRRKSLDKDSKNKKKSKKSICHKSPAKKVKESHKPGMILHCQLMCTQKHYSNCKLLSNINAM